MKPTGIPLSDLDCISFLIDQPDALKVGIFYPFQMIDSVPLEPHDVRLDLIVSKEF